MNVVIVTVVLTRFTTAVARCKVEIAVARSCYVYVV